MAFVNEQGYREAVIKRSWRGLDSVASIVPFCYSDASSNELREKIQRLPGEMS